MDHVLRTADSTDEKRIRELFVEMLRTIYNTNDVDDYEDGYLDKFFCGGDDLIYIAEAGVDIAAFLSVEVYRDDDYIYLDDLSVTEKYRGCGIGTRLIEAAQEYSRGLGISRIVLHVEKSNQGAHRLYLRLGYIDDEEQGSRIRMIKKIV